jgi:hypothetical protein
VSHQAWPARSAARSTLIRLKREAKKSGDAERARTLATSQRAMDVASELFRKGWYKG